MKILVNCYACSPYKGSEPGMGWNFVKALSQTNELHIITEKKFKTDIERYFEENPLEKEFYHFYYIKRTRLRTLRKIWPPSYYWTYESWQKKVLSLAKDLDKKEHFDVIHQLNMTGYREPGYLWKMDKPFVWGPIGGFDNVPWCMIPTMGLYGLTFYTAYNLMNSWQKHTNRRVKKAMTKANALISATQGMQTAIRHLYGKESVIIPEVGLTSSTECHICERKPNEKLKLCWSGLHIPRKSLNLLIESMAELGRDNIELHVIGKGSETTKWKKLADKKGVNNIIWHGWVLREEALAIMQSCHVFCITSLNDLTSTVILEALSYGMPTIALDHCGFSNILTDVCGIKVPIINHKQVVSDYAKAIVRLADDEYSRRKMAKSARCRALVFNWEDKAEQINSIYKTIIQ